jgi:signal transduction histidine kinase
MEKQANILVIDDEKSMRDSCSQVLRKKVCMVETAEDALSGLEKVNLLRPDLVLVDLKMPGMSGMEFLDKIKEIDSSIVPVVITGYATLDSAIDAMKRGAYDFLPKPFSPDELWIVVERGLERRKLILKTISLQEEKEKMNAFFITMVSHQLKSPLATVHQNLDVVLGNFLGEVPEKQKQMLIRVKGSIKGLIALIKDLLVLLRINHGDISHSSETIVLDQFLADVAQPLRQMAEEKKIYLKINGTKLVSVKGNRQSLAQLFTNLINNAIKFNREGGSVDVNIAEGEKYVEISVSDTGIGIEDKDLPLMFNEFFRASNSQNLSINGTGLGLAIARKIAELHSGFIKAASVFGKGSTFTVGLPRMKKAG